MRFKSYNTKYTGTEINYVKYWLNLLYNQIKKYIDHIKNPKINNSFDQLQKPKSKIILINDLIDEIEGRKLETEPDW